MGLRTRVIAGGLGLALLLAACSMSDDPLTASSGEPVATTAAPSFEGGEGAQLGARTDALEAPTDMEDVSVPDTAFPPLPDDVKVIRDGRIDLRIDQGDFGDVSAQVRRLADDFGGYVSSGESHLEDIDGESYAVGWFTLRIPEVRFEEALGQAEKLGERVGLSVSSQDVGEEYVDLEGRLSYWKSQEAFYLRLMGETDEVGELVALQNQMRDVLLQIEAIEGRIRYLDNRTTFSTLTVGLTEVPGAIPIPVDEPVAEPGILMQGLETAGTVLLSVMAFLIVAAAFALPIVIVALIVLGLWRAFGGGRRKQPTPTEA
jgi:Domain of unknown function (DUF4349)